MIPEHDIEIIRQVRYPKLKTPAGRFLSTGEKISNHEYFDMRGYNWDSYRHVYDVERKIINYADINSTNIETFEEVLDELYDRDALDISELLSLDAGVASAVVALSASGCAPLVSCRGHPGGYSEVPMLMFYSDINTAKRVVSAMKPHRVGAEDRSTYDGYRGVLVNAANITEMMNFAQTLYKTNQIIKG